MATIASDASRARCRAAWARCRSTGYRPPPAYLAATRTRTRRLIPGARPPGRPENRTYTIGGEIRLLELPVGPGAARKRLRHESASRCAHPFITRFSRMEAGQACVRKAQTPISPPPSCATGKAGLRLGVRHVMPIARFGGEMAAGSRRAEIRATSSDLRRHRIQGNDLRGQSDCIYIREQARTAPCQ